MFLFISYFTLMNKFKAVGVVISSSFRPSSTSHWNPFGERYKSFSFLISGLNIFKLFRSMAYWEFWSLRRKYISNFYFYLLTSVHEKDSFIYFEVMLICFWKPLLYQTTYKDIIYFKRNIGSLSSDFILKLIAMFIFHCFVLYFLCKYRCKNSWLWKLYKINWK